MLNKAKECAQKLGLSGMWYVVRAQPEKNNDVAGHFLMVPDAMGDRLVMIRIDDCKVFLVSTSRFLYIEMLGKWEGTDNKVSDKIF